MTAEGAIGHPIRRAAERYGVALAPADVADMERHITWAVAAFARPIVVQRRTGREVWLVRFGAVWMVVVYEPRSGRVLTVLPPHAQFDAEGRNLLGEYDAEDELLACG